VRPTSSIDPVPARADRSVTVAPRQVGQQRTPPPSSRRSSAALQLRHDTTSGDESGDRSLRSRSCDQALCTGNSQTETCEVLSPSKVERSQPAQRCRKDMPANLAMRSSSDGQT